MIALVWGKQLKVERKAIEGLPTRANLRVTGASGGAANKKRSAAKAAAAAAPSAAAGTGADVGGVMPPSAAAVRPQPIAGVSKRVRRGPPEPAHVVQPSAVGDGATVDLSAVTSELALMRSDMQGLNKLLDVNSQLQQDLSKEKLAHVRASERQHHAEEQQRSLQAQFSEKPHRESPHAQCGVRATFKTTAS